MQTTDFQVQWKEAMDWWRGQTDLVQRLIRNVANQKLIDRGAEEIGSSDTNHSVFGLYQEFKTCGHNDVIIFLRDSVA